MFDLFRSRAKAVRYLLGALLVMVALSMVVTMIPGYGTGGGSQDMVVAEIGKEALTIRDVQQQMQTAIRNGAVSRGSESFFAQQLIDEMIATRAMIYLAKQNGLDVSDAELARFLQMGFPQLFPNGQFVGKQAYAMILQQQGMTIPEFEAQLRQQIIMSRINGIVTDTAIVTPAEMEQEYRRRNEKVKLEYIAFTPEKYASEASVPPGTVRAFFEKTRDQYRVPEQRSFDVLIADEARMGEKITVSDADLRRSYDMNKDQYRVPERVHVRHILLKTTDKPKDEIAKIQAKAEDVLKQVKSGADFAELARKISEDPGSAAKGGDLGWVTRGQTVPAFESTAFALRPKETSGVIKTEYGFHILQVLEKEDAHVKPFEEVKDQLAQERKREQVFDMMQRATDQARDELQKSPSQAAEIAARLGLERVHVDHVSGTTAIPELGSSRELVEAATGLPKGGVTPVVQVKGNKLAVAVVTEVSPARPAEFSEVEAPLRTQLTANRVTDIVLNHANDALAKAKAGNSDLKKVAEQMGATVSTTQDFSEDGAADGIGPAALVQQAFREQVGTVFGPVTVDRNRYVCKVVSRTPADIAKLDAAAREEIRAAVKERKARERSELFLDSIRTALTREGKIKIHRDVMERVIGSYRS